MVLFNEAYKMCMDLAMELFNKPIEELNDEEKKIVKTKMRENILGVKNGN